MRECNHCGITSNRRSTTGGYVIMCYVDYSKEQVPLCENCYHNYQTRYDNHYGNTN